MTDNLYPYQKKVMEELRRGDRLVIDPPMDCGKSIPPLTGYNGLRATVVWYDEMIEIGERRYLLNPIFDEAHIALPPPSPKPVDHLSPGYHEQERVRRRALALSLAAKLN